MLPPSAPPKLSLKSVIDRHPLTISADTSLWQAIAIMSKAQSSCVVPGLELSLNRVLANQVRASALWVVDQQRVLGVFTEALALWAIASHQDLSTVAVSEVMTQPAIALSLSDTLADESDLFTALTLLRQHHTHPLPVLDGQHQLVGTISFPQIRAALHLDELLKSEPLANILLSPVLQASVTTSGLELCRQMSDHHGDRIIITDPEQEQEPWVGMVLAQDLIHLQALERDLSTIQAHDIMSHSLLCLSPTQSALAGYWEMQQHQVQSFVVVGDRHTLLGYVTPTSFLQTLDLATLRTAETQIQQSIAHFASTHPSEVAPADSDGENSPSELLEQLECSRLLSTMALHIRESLNLDEILQTAVNEVRQFLQTDRVIIYRFNPDMSGVVAVESLAPGWQPALNNRLHDTCFGQNYAQAYKAGRTQVVEDIYTAGLTQCHIDILVLFDIRASLVVPILQGDHLWGLLCAYHCSGPRQWRLFEVDLLKQLAIHVAIAIQQSELYQQVQNELTERKRAEEQLKVSLKEKESLIKEIHHRVKNNLQIISSVLRLQSDYIKDERILALFDESQHRIRSMALIHEKLYQSKDLSRIDMGEYVCDLTDNLLRSYAAFSQNITLQVDVNNIWLDVDTAIPCGLVINELISNSLKHAFSDSHQQDNLINVTITHDDHNQYQLTVSDNGIGLPKDIDFRNTESLGLELVCIFAEQLGGEIHLNNRPGTSFTITFHL